MHLIDFGLNHVQQAGILQLNHCIWSNSTKSDKMGCVAQIGDEVELHVEVAFTSGSIAQSNLAVCAAELESYKLRGVFDHHFAFMPRIVQTIAYRGVFQMDVQTIACCGEVSREIQFLSVFCIDFFDFACMHGGAENGIGGGTNVTCEPDFELSTRHFRF